MPLTPYPSLATLPEVIANDGKLPTRMIDAFAARTVYASSIAGVELDCDLATGARIGGGIPADNAARLNAVLATATAANPVHLVIDGPSALGSPLVIPSTGHVTISGLGWSTGFFVLPGSNCSGIQNFPATNLAEYQTWNPGGPTGIVGEDVTLRDFYLCGNRGTYPAGNVDGSAGDGTLTGQSFSPNAKGLYTGAYWLSGIVLRGVDNLHISGVYVYDAPTYHINLYRCTNFWIHSCRLEAGDPTVQNNTDGIHLNDGCSRGRIWDCDLAMGDDAFALNLREGGGASGGDIVVSNCHVDALAIARIYGKGATTLDRVIFSNITGTVSWYGFTIGEVGSPDAGAEPNRSILLQNIRVKVIGRPGRADWALVLVSGNCGSLVLDGCEFSDPTVACPMVRMDANSPVISALRMVNCGVHRSAAGNAAAYAIEASRVGSRIGDLTIDGFRVTEQVGQDYADIPALANFDGTAVGRITADARVDGVGKVLNITASSAIGGVAAKDIDHKSNAGPANSYSIVAATSSGTIPVSVGRYTGVNVLGLASGAVSLTGPGLVSSGFTFADSLIADGTIYRSSTQTALCCKLEGSAIPFSMGTAPAATGYALTGPASGMTGMASANFTVAPDGAYTGSISITPGGGGLSTPIVKTFSGSSAAQVFTITPTADGTVTLTPTNSGSLANPSPLSYVASASSPGAAFAAYFDGSANPTGGPSPDDGTGTALGRANSSALQAPASNGPFSVFGWYRPTDASYLAGRLGPILGKFGSTAEYMLFYANGPGKLAFFLNGTQLNASTPVAPNAWHFAVGVFDGANIRLYVNGIEEGTAAPATSVQGASGFQIGGADGTSNFRAKGHIAQVGKYDSALTGAQVAWLYNSGRGRGPAEILAQSGLTTPACLYGFEDPGNLGLDSGPNGFNLANVTATGPTQSTGPG